MESSLQSRVSAFFRKKTNKTRLVYGITFSHACRFKTSKEYLNTPPFWMDNDKDDD